MKPDIVAAKRMGHGGKGMKMNEQSWWGVCWKSTHKFRTSLDKDLRAGTFCILPFSSVNVYVTCYLTLVLFMWQIKLCEKKFCSQHSETELHRHVFGARTAEDCDYVWCVFFLERVKLSNNVAIVSPTCCSDFFHIIDTVIFGGFKRLWNDSHQLSATVGKFSKFYYFLLSWALHLCFINSVGVFLMKL